MAPLPFFLCGKKTANLIGFAAPVLLRPALERLLDAYLRARHEPPAEQRKAQQQDQAQKQREGTHVWGVISLYAADCQEPFHGVLGSSGGSCNRASSTFAAARSLDQTWLIRSR